MRGKHLFFFFFSWPISSLRHNTRVLGVVKKKKFKKINKINSICSNELSQISRWPNIKFQEMVFSCYVCAISDNCFIIHKENNDRRNLSLTLSIYYVYRYLKNSCIIIISQQSLSIPGTSTVYWLTRLLVKLLRYNNVTDTRRIIYDG